MGMLFCFSVFGRKMKATKPKLDKEIFQPSKGMGDPCGVVHGMALEKSFLVIDSPYSCSTWSETAGSKEASIEQRHCMSSIMESTTSTDPHLDSNLVRNLSTEPVMQAEEAGESHNDLSSCSLLGMNKCINEGASVSMDDSISKSGDESRGLYITKSFPDTHGDCADVSEVSFEGLEWVSNPPSCEDFNRPSGKIISLYAHPPEYMGTGNQFIPLSQTYSMDGAQQPNDVISSGYGGEGVMPRTGSLYSPDTAGFPSSKSDGTLLNDEILTGHISDPGVYERDERLSMSESSVLLSNSIIAPLVTIGPTLRKSESDSYICELLPSEGNAENTSAETGEHGSSPREPTFCSADNVILKCKSSSKVLDFNKQNSWWKNFMVSHGNIHFEGLKEASNAVAFGGESDEMPPNPLTGYSSDICDIGHSSEHNDAFKDTPTGTEGAGKEAFAENDSEHGQEDGGIVLDMGVQASYGTSLWPSKDWSAFSTAESGLSRVEEWILNIQQYSVPTEEIAPENKELSSEICVEEAVDFSSAMQKTVEATSIDVELANAAIRSLNPFSTVAHIAGFGLREVPSLGKFNSLKTLNLSTNNIVRVQAGCLPRSLHTLDLSRNRISVIEGFRELSRLRVLNLSYNRISRIGHGLANCTLIKELYLVGNKIAEVEGLHRLLKLSILDLSFNKLTTSKALGQLAANYSSLLALNLLGNPVHMNIGEEQLRKLVLSITPQVTYLNKQPIKAVLAREAVVDSVARAALGTSQRNTKSGVTRASRKVAEARPTNQQSKSHSRHGKDVERKRSSLFSESESSKPARLPTQHHHHRQHNDGRQSEKGVAKDHRHSGRAPVSVHELLLQKLAMDTEIQGMHRSRSDSALQDQVQ